MIKQVLSGEEARKAIIKGVDLVANPVVSTLGIFGKNVILGKRHGSDIHKDGANIARYIVVKDDVDAIGADIVKEAAFKTLKEAGDGTTTATLLTQEILKQGFKQVAAGRNGMLLKKGIDKAVNKVVANLKELSITVDTDSDLIKNVASISANNDTSIGELISEAYQKIGKHGIVSMEESLTDKTEVKVVEGYQVDRGYLTGHFINNQEKLTCELQDTYILITDMKIESMKEIQPMLEFIYKSKKSLLIIAEDVTGEALPFIVSNVIQGAIKVCPIGNPSFGEARKQMLEDIAKVTGGTVITEELGMRINDINDETFLGYAKKVVVGRDETTIVNAAGKKEFIEERVAHAKTLIENATSDYDQKQNEIRLAKLSNGLAIIYVGAATEVERKDKKERIDDAIRAAKSAIEEGIVAGGGTTLIRCISSLDSIETDSEDEKIGVDIIRKTLEKPLYQICENGGINGGTVIDKVKSLSGNIGYNAKTNSYEDLISSGVIDATKVSRCSLQNAASVAGMIITSDYLIPNED